MTYTLGGTDAASFDIVAATGQLQTEAALDYETKSSYEVTVTATDADGATDTTVAIEVTNIVELITITGPAEVTFAENGAGRVASYTASSNEDEHGIGWIVTGTDGAHFTIDAPGGVLRFHIDPIAPTSSPSCRTSSPLTTPTRTTSTRSRCWRRSGRTSVRPSRSQ